MTEDRAVTEHLMETLQDGRDGFAHAAEQLEDSERADLSPKFAGYSAQRAAFYQELETLAAAYGDDVDESGSVTATIHRAWMSVKGALSGLDPERILDTAEQGEDHAVSAYEDALERNISSDLRSTVERQFSEVRATRDEVKLLRNAIG